MSKFIEYFGSAHLNSMNVGAYETENGVTLKSENVATDTIYGEKEFESYEDAENWFGELPGINNVSRLDSALEILDGKK